MSAAVAIAIDVGLAVLGVIGIFEVIAFVILGILQDPYFDDDEREP